MKRMEKSKKKQKKEKDIFEPDSNRGEDNEFLKSNHNFFKLESKESEEIKSNSGMTTITTNDIINDNYYKSKASSALNIRNRNYSEDIESSFKSNEEENEYQNNEDEDKNNEDEDKNNEDKNNEDEDKNNDNEDEDEDELIVNKNISNYFNNNENISDRNENNFYDQISVESLNSDDKF